jgi:hypothetical protein
MYMSAMMVLNETMNGAPRVNDFDDLPAQIRRRKTAAAGMSRLECGLRDPLLERADGPRAPSTFGLTAPELIAEARRLHRAGWALWEIELTLALPDRAGV